MSTCYVAGPVKLYKPVIIFWGLLLIMALFIATVTMDLIFQLNGMGTMFVGAPDGKPIATYFIGYIVAALLFLLFYYMIRYEKTYEVDIFIPMNHCRFKEYKNCFHLVYNDNMFRYENKRLLKQMMNLKMLKMTGEYDLIGKHIKTHITIGSQL